MRNQVICALLGILLLAPFANAQQGGTLVVTDSLKMLDFHDQITLVGRTRAVISSRIVSEVAGQVEVIDAPEGNWIKKGKSLVTIDSERIRLDFEAADAQSKRAEAQSTLAIKDLARTEDLYKRSLISESRIDSVRVAATIAENNYRQLKANRDRLALDLENSKISAPFSGYTIRQLVDVGEWVNVGSPVYEMVDLSEIKVTVDLPEKHFGHVEKGSLVQIKTSGDNLPLTGKVTGIAPRASEATHTFPVIVTVKNTDGRLGGGMLVRATLSLSDVFSSLAVSKDAIVRQGPQTMIYTVVEGKAAPIPVQTSSTNGQMVAVSGQGLIEGMLVVIRGNERIFPGSPVRTADQAEATGPGDASEPKNN